MKMCDLTKAGKGVVTTILTALALLAFLVITPAPNVVRAGAIDAKFLRHTPERANPTCEPATGSLVLDMLKKVDIEMVEVFRKAWVVSGSGTRGTESLVLIFRLPCGGYRGVKQRSTNQHEKFSFRWNPEAVAIVHTHPNNCDPRPSMSDREIADDRGTPIFTITQRGLYVYDPTTKRITKVMNKLDWLNPDKWTGEAHLKNEFHKAH